MGTKRISRGLRMIRGFLSGVFWGTAVSALGLGAVSQLTPLPVARITAEASAVPRAKPAVVETPVSPEVAVPEVKPATLAPVPELTPEPTPESTPAPASPAPVTPAPVTPAPVTQVLVPPAGSEFAEPLPDVTPVAPAGDVAPVSDTATAPLAQLATDEGTQANAPSVAPKTGLEAPKLLDAPDGNGDAGAVVAGDDGTKIALVVPGQVTVPGADTAPLAVQDPAPPTKSAPEDGRLKPVPEILPMLDGEVQQPAQIAPDPVLVPVTDPATGDPAMGDAAKSSATLQPTPGLDGKVDGVTIGRLPKIGDAPAASEAEISPASEANPDGSPALAIDGDADLPPLQKYARTFENPDAKPLFAIILIDTGGADLDRASLAAMPFPVTFALDPLAANAAEASAIYRAAGQEVIMVATGIPAGATPSDLEVTFASHAIALPEAVAVIDTEFGAFQADRPLATQVVPILKAQGRGLISWDRGLNAADQVARREGLAAGMVFRKLDGQGENKSAVRRALDRAAFKAAQDGRVMVIGQTLPQTVAALTEWAVAGRATSVALAPVSAVLTTQ